MNGSFESHDFGALFQDINAKFEGNRDQIVVREFSAYDGYQGLITGNGSIALNPRHHFPFKAFVKIQDATLLSLDYINGNVGGELTLFGDLHRADLKGQIAANPLNINIPEKIPELMQTVDVIYINQPRNEPPPQKHDRPSSNWPLHLDIDFTVPENGYITGRDLTSQWHGDFKIGGTTASPLFYGEYKIIKGVYVFNGKDFDINEGTITLSGDLKKTTAYIIASKDMDEVKVEIILKGPLNKPAISFRSNPPLPQREILSWILFNKGTSEISAFQGSQLNESITNLSTKQEGPDILTKIRTTFGIDRIDIGNSQGRNLRSNDISSGKIHF